MTRPSILDDADGTIVRRLAALKDERIAWARRDCAKVIDAQGHRARALERCPVHGAQACPGAAMAWSPMECERSDHLCISPAACSARGNCLPF
ncbi:MAG TPA: hypothetical protein VFW46_20100 [Stellaceae bacterium]|nr:hypothetical protein [Stellaceae bacterium]